MKWAIFCWESLGPGRHVNITLTHATYLHIIASQANLFMATVFPNDSASFSSIMSATLQKLFRKADLAAHRDHI